MNLNNKYLKIQILNIKILKIKKKTHTQGKVITSNCLQKLPVLPVVFFTPMLFNFVGIVNKKVFYINFKPFLLLKRYDGFFFPL